VRRIVFVLVLFCALLVAACDEGGTEPSLPADSASVSFTTEDGVTLRGHLFGSGSAGIILAHMYPADQTSWYAAAQKLADRGYRVLTFDFRGYGESDGSKDIESLDKDVFAAIMAIRDAGASDMVLVGASMGGTASLAAADASQVLSSLRVTGVVTVSAPVAFQGLTAAEAVPRLYMPLMFIAAGDDVGESGAEALQELAAGKGELRIVPGDEHGTELFEGPAADEVWDLLLAFLAENLPATGR
jgi:pimeloyl-ACP methyl ester carboxylesterase